ncbi:unnamed protein product [Darwinula stevensoni]|uniref:Uncharacterized protein n=1 Tax=Darwinula stevensoni TaxID=69355 RepID=A0A7R8X4U5_9CRUS|nr:unnamed protein product [Darwinula stevensoni]CAG0886433.1 unnamed protein product [Darwinula stevensoni]
MTRISIMPHVHKDMSHPLMKTSYDHECFPPRKFEVREFFCGWGAAFINITVTFPLNKVMFRQCEHYIGMRGLSISASGQGGVVGYRCPGSSSPDRRHDEIVYRNAGLTHTGVGKPRIPI